MKAKINKENWHSGSTQNIDSGKQKQGCSKKEKLTFKSIFVKKHLRFT